MKKLSIVMICLAGILSGCVVHDPHRHDGAYRGERDRDRDGIPNRVDRDRDGDGVRNRQDARPNDPRRY